jgi:aminoglycoside phosphotransferase (APT) family kinase protein
VEPFDLDLTDWVAGHEERLAWGEPDLERLRSVAMEAQAALDEVGRVSLVHSDLNPKNVLLDRETLEVTAVLDWEFAHAGSPYADLGNLLRFDRQPSYAEGVLRGYTDLRGGSATTARDRARCADLVALVDLAARKDANPVAARAHEQLLAIARSGDLHACAGA